MSDTSKDSRKDLRHEISQLDPSLLERLRAAGFDPSWLVGQAAQIARGTEEERAAHRDARNRVKDEVTPPRPDEIFAAPTWGSPESEGLAARGNAAIARGELAFCVMAGGMATRMGGVVKALVEAFDGNTFLALRLTENATVSARAGRPLPLWLMTSEATDGPIRDALHAAHAGEHIRTFTQGMSLRLTPDGGLFREKDGQPSTHATGHGDLVDAVRRSGLLRSFRKAGGKYVWIANLDNLGATVDPAVLGTFIAANTDVMVEVCEKAAGDRGGIPVHAEGRLQVLEEFRLPRGFDANQVRVFNTNTFLVRAERLLDVEVAWSWFEVEKKVDGKTAVQFERLLQEITSALDAAYVRVPRHGAAARFLPAKDLDELARRRPDIEAVARARGMLAPSAP